VNLALIQENKSVKKIVELSYRRMQITLEADN